MLFTLIELDGMIYEIDKRAQEPKKVKVEEAYVVVKSLFVILVRNNFLEN